MFVAEIFPEKINKMISSKNLGFIDVNRTELYFHTKFYFISGKQSSPATEEYSIRETVGAPLAKLEDDLEIKASEEAIDAVVTSEVSPKPTNSQPQRSEKEGGIAFGNTLKALRKRATTKKKSIDASDDEQFEKKNEILEHDLMVTNPPSTSSRSANLQVSSFENQTTEAIIEAVPSQEEEAVDTMVNDIEISEAVGIVQSALSSNESTLRNNEKSSNDSFEADTNCLLMEVSNIPKVEASPLTASEAVPAALENPLANDAPVDNGILTKEKQPENDNYEINKPASSYETDNAKMRRIRTETIESEVKNEAKGKDDILTASKKQPRPMSPPTAIKIPENKNEVVEELKSHVQKCDQMIEKLEPNTKEKVEMKETLPSKEIVDKSTTIGHMKNEKSTLHPASKTIGTNVSLPKAANDKQSTEEKDKSLNEGHDKDKKHSLTEKASTSVDSTFFLPSDNKIMPSDNQIAAETSDMIEEFNESPGGARKKRMKNKGNKKVAEVEKEFNQIERASETSFESIGNEASEINMSENKSRQKSSKKASNVVFDTNVLSGKSLEHLTQEPTGFSKSIFSNTSKSESNQKENIPMGLLLDERSNQTVEIESTAKEELSEEKHLRSSNNDISQSKSQSEIESIQNQARPMGLHLDDSSKLDSEINHNKSQVISKKASEISIKSEIYQEKNSPMGNLNSDNFVDKKAFLTEVEPKIESEIQNNSTILPTNEESSQKQPTGINLKAVMKSIEANVSKEAQPEIDLQFTSADKSLTPKFDTMPSMLSSERKEEKIKRSVQKRSSIDEKGGKDDLNTETETLDQRFHEKTLQPETTPVDSSPEIIERSVQKRSSIDKKGGKDDLNTETEMLLHSFHEKTLQPETTPVDPLLEIIEKAEDIDAKIRNAHNVAQPQHSLLEGFEEMEIKSNITPETSSHQRKDPKQKFANTDISPLLEEDDSTIDSFDITITDQRHDLEMSHHKVISGPDKKAAEIERQGNEPHPLTETRSLDLENNNAKEPPPKKEVEKVEKCSLTSPNSLLQFLSEDTVPYKKADPDWPSIQSPTALTDIAYTFEPELQFETDDEEEDSETRSPYFSTYSDTNLSTPTSPATIIEVDPEEFQREAIIQAFVEDIEQLQPPQIEAAEAGGGLKNCLITECNQLSKTSAIEVDEKVDMIVEGATNITCFPSGVPRDEDKVATASKAFEAATLSSFKNNDTLDKMASSSTSPATLGSFESLGTDSLSIAAQRPELPPPHVAETAFSSRPSTNFEDGVTNTSPLRHDESQQDSGFYDDTTLLPFSLSDKNHRNSITETTPEKTRQNEKVRSPSSFLTQSLPSLVVEDLDKSDKNDNEDNVSCHTSCALMKSLSANNSRRNSSTSKTSEAGLEQRKSPSSFTDLLQDRRKKLAKYNPESDPQNSEVSGLAKPEIPQKPDWMTTRASIIKKSHSFPDQNDEQLQFKNVEETKDENIAKKIFSENVKQTERNQIRSKDVSMTKTINPLEKLAPPSDYDVIKEQSEAEVKQATDEIEGIEKSRLFKAKKHDDVLPFESDLVSNSQKIEPSSSEQVQKREDITQENQVEESSETNMKYEQNIIDNGDIKTTNKPQGIPDPSYERNLGKETLNNRHFDNDSHEAYETTTSCEKETALPDNYDKKASPNDTTSIESESSISIPLPETSEIAKEEEKVPNVTVISSETISTKTVTENVSYDVDTTETSNLQASVIKDEAKNGKFNNSLTSEANLKGSAFPDMVSNLAKVEGCQDEERILHSSANENVGETFENNDFEEKIPEAISLKVDEDTSKQHGSEDKLEKIFSVEKILKPREPQFSVISGEKPDINVESQEPFEIISNETLAAPAYEVIGLDNTIIEYTTLDDTKLPLNTDDMTQSSSMPITEETAGKTTTFDTNKMTSKTLKSDLELLEEIIDIPEDFIVDEVDNPNLANLQNLDTSSKKSNDAFTEIGANTLEIEVSNTTIKGCEFDSIKFESNPKFSLTHSKSKNIQLSRNNLGDINLDEVAEAKVEEIGRKRAQPELLEVQPPISDTLEKLSSTRNSCGDIEQPPQPQPSVAKKGLLPEARLLTAVPQSDPLSSPEASKVVTTVFLGLEDEPKVCLKERQADESCHNSLNLINAASQEVEKGAFMTKTIDSYTDITSENNDMVEERTHPNENIKEESLEVEEMDTKTLQNKQIKREQFPEAKINSSTFNTAQEEAFYSNNTTLKGIKNISHADVASTASAVADNLMDELEAEEAKNISTAVKRGRRRSSALSIAATFDEVIQVKPKIPPKSEAVKKIIAQAKPSIASLENANKPASNSSSSEDLQSGPPTPIVPIITASEVPEETREVVAGGTDRTIYSGAASTLINDQPSTLDQQDEADRSSATFSTLQPLTTSAYTPLVKDESSETIKLDLALEIENERLREEERVNEGEFLTEWGQPPTSSGKDNSETRYEI